MEQAIKDVIEMAWPTLVIFVSVVVIMRVAYLIKSERKSFKFYEEIFMLFFLVYLLVLFQLVTTQDLIGGEANLMPFREILRYNIGSEEFYKQVVGNILLFAPLGFFATSYCKIKGFGGIIIISSLSSLIIESVQHFIGRTFDVDDIILNVVGGIIGFILYFVLNTIRNKLPKFLQKDFIYNIISLLVIIFIALYFVKIF